MIPEDELTWRFVRASGPGGQHVNKTATAVQLFWNAARSRVVDAPTLARLRRLAGRRMRTDGTIVIEAAGSRSQADNRREALHRLEALLAQARQRPKSRRPTTPSRAARQRRLDAKRRRSRVKSLRRSPLED